MLEVKRHFHVNKLAAVSQLSTPVYICMPEKWLNTLSVFLKNLKILWLSPLVPALL
jgi:hypothetical protein